VGNYSALSDSVNTIVFHRIELAGQVAYRSTLSRGNVIGLRMEKRRGNRPECFLRMR